MEWSDGGAERDVEALLQKIEAAVVRYCANLEDQSNQIQEAMDENGGSPGQAQAGAAAAAPDHDDGQAVLMAPPGGDDPFPLPPGSEDFGVVEDPLPPLARAANQVPPLPDAAASASAPTATTEP